MTLSITWAMSVNVTRLESLYGSAVIGRYLLPAPIPARPDGCMYGWVDFFMGTGPITGVDCPIGAILWDDINVLA